EVAVREKEVAAREKEVANSGIDNLVREALQKIGLVAEDAKVKLSSQHERQGKHFDDVSRSAKQQLADLHEHNTTRLDDVCQAAKQQLTSQGGHSDSLKQDIKTVVDSMNSLAIDSQAHADALAEDVKGNAQGHFDTLFQKLDELPQLFPVDRYTEWQKVDIDLTSIIAKVDAVKADISNLTSITTSAPSQQLNRGKRPSETSLEAPERSQRRRSSQQDPATSRPESPLSLRMTTRGQTQSQSQTSVQTGPQTQVQVQPAQGPTSQGTVALPAGTAPSHEVAPIWNQIGFTGDKWTPKHLGVFLDHLESFVSKDQPVETRIDSCARSKLEQCLLTYMRKKARSFPDGEENACGHCANGGPCIRVKLVADLAGTFDPQYNGKRWLMEVRPDVPFDT
ncbi:MAG: hypothetical protein Q9180_007451, partial [Flavoplaca navasiana]